jgi:hypothetical protein
MENCFRTATSPKSYLAQIRGFSWQNNEIKRIRGQVITVVITSKTQIKEKN